MLKQSFWAEITLKLEMFLTIDFNTIQGVLNISSNSEKLKTLDFKTFQRVQLFPIVYRPNNFRG